MKDYRESHELSVNKVLQSTPEMAALFLQALVAARRDLVARETTTDQSLIIRHFKIRERTQ